MRRPPRRVSTQPPGGARGAVRGAASGGGDCPAGEHGGSPMGAGTARPQRGAEPSVLTTHWTLLQGLRVLLAWPPACKAAAVASIHPTDTETETQSSRAARPGARGPRTNVTLTCATAGWAPAYALALGTSPFRLLHCVSR